MSALRIHDGCGSGHNGFVGCVQYQSKSLEIVFKKAAARSDTVHVLQVTKRDAIVGAYHRTSDRQEH